MIVKDIKQHKVDETLMINLRHFVSNYNVHFLTEKNLNDKKK